MSIKDMLRPNDNYVHQLNIAKIKRADMVTQKKLAMLRDFFYEEDTHVITEVLKTDLRKYVETTDISRMKLITLDFLIPAFMAKICNVYDKQVKLVYDDKFKKEAEKLEVLLSEVRFNRFLGETIEKTKLHNTLLVHVKYNKNLDKIFLDNNYNVGTAYVVEHDEDSTDYQIIAYEWYSADEKIQWVVWDRITKEHYVLETDDEFPKFEPDKGSLRLVGKRYFKVGNNEDFTAPYEGKMPWIIRRMKNHNNQFWGNGMDSLVELNRSLNILLTVCNDDTIQETIRLLILNFNPTGTKNEDGKLKTGLRHPLWSEGSLGRENDPTAQVVSADLYNEEVFGLVEKLTDIVSSMHNIDSPLKAHLEQSLSGIALKLKTEPLLRQWSKDIEAVKHADIELIQKIVMVHNYYRDNDTIDEKLLDSLSIEYQEPNIVTDEKADYELLRMKWEDGLSTPAHKLAKDTGNSIDWAIEEIKRNKEILAILGISQNKGFTFKK